MIRALFVASLLVACSGSPGGPTMNNKMNQGELGSSRSRVETGDILKREPRTSRSMVKHILIGWNDKAEAYNGRIDARAAARTQADAEAQVDEIRAKLDAGESFDDLMNAHSEDTGLKSNPDGYEVKPDSGLVLEFRTLGLRLEVGEVGVVETDFGFHIMKREE